MSFEHAHQAGRVNSRSPTGVAVAMPARLLLPVANPARLRLLPLLGALSLASACTPMFATRLSKPVRSELGAVTLDADEVHLDTQLRVQDFSTDSRVMVALTLEARRPTTFSLRALRLVLTDAFGRRSESAAIASGVGQPPEFLEDDEHAATLTLTPGEPVRAWVAFGGIEPRQTRELPERIVLHVPAEATPSSMPAEAAPAEASAATAAPAEAELVLSEPGREPVWQAEATSSSTGIGFHVQGWADDVALNLMLTEGHSFIDPLVMTTSFGIGVRGTCEGGSDRLCENLALRMQLGWPLWTGRTGALSPYLGGELAWAPDNDASTDTRFGTIGGPSLGIDIALAPLVPHHGPFPVSYARSPLGEVHMNVGFVWWFGDDTGNWGSPGVTMTVSHAYGR